MRLLTTLAAVAVLAAAVPVLALKVWPVPAEQPVGEMVGDPKRGAYLARLSGCITCHTAPDQAPLSGGAALNSRFGSFYAPNITPDVEAGIGDWTFPQFVRAVRQGISPSGEPYYPSFPYEFYASLTDRDLADIWAALREVPPSPTSSKDHSIGFPFNIRSGVKVWRTFFERPVQYEPDPERTVSWNRGKFMVEGPAHCGACHTPRNLAGGLQVDNPLAGDPQMQDGGNSPPITRKALTARGWTKDALVTALRTGVLPNGDAFGGSMVEVVHGSTKYLLNDHLEDMANYLLDLDG